MEKLSDAEYKQMFQLLHRHVETQMDQWDQWKFEGTHGKVYITIAMYPLYDEDGWVDVTHLL